MDGVETGGVGVGVGVAVVGGAVVGVGVGIEVVVEAGLLVGLVTLGLEQPTIPTIRVKKAILVQRGFISSASLKFVVNPKL